MSGYERVISVLILIRLKPGVWLADLWQPDLLIWYVVYNIFWLFIVNNMQFSQCSASVSIALEKVVKTSKEKEQLPKQEKQNERVKTWRELSFPCLTKNGLLLILVKNLFSSLSDIIVRSLPDIDPVNLMLLRSLISLSILLPVWSAGLIINLSLHQIISSICYTHNAKPWHQLSDPDATLFYSLTPPLLYFYWSCLLPGIGSVIFIILTSSLKSHWWLF